MPPSTSKPPLLPADISTSSSSKSTSQFSFKDATYDEVLEDLSSRFILNLPDEELSSIERVCFQVEQAHWYYEDFVRESNPRLPSLPLKKFSAMLFKACPMLHQWSHDHEEAFDRFMQYKTRVPVCGVIILNSKMDKCVLVKGWKASSGWGFPKGKINQNEKESDCAIREVLEETGCDVSDYVNEDEYIHTVVREQSITLFIVHGIPEDFQFKTRTRKEISKIEWFKLTDLPTWKRKKDAPGKFYLITPFISQLQEYITRHRRIAKAKQVSVAQDISVERGLENVVPVNSTTIATRSSDNESSTKETSSLSSSNENTDPATPSPERSVFHQAAIVAGPTHPNQTMMSSMQTLDPHLAGLLTGLNMSAQSITANLQPELPDIEPPKSMQRPPSPDDLSAGSSPQSIPYTSSDPRDHASQESSPADPQESIPPPEPELPQPPPTHVKHLKHLALLEHIAEESQQIPKLNYMNMNPAPVPNHHVPYRPASAVNPRSAPYPYPPPAPTILPPIYPPPHTIYPNVPRPSTSQANVAGIPQTHTRVPRTSHQNQLLSLLSPAPSFALPPSRSFVPPQYPPPPPPSGPARPMDDPFTVRYDLPQAQRVPRPPSRAPQPNGHELLSILNSSSLSSQRSAASPVRSSTL